MKRTWLMIFSITAPLRSLKRALFCSNRLLPLVSMEMISGPNSRTRFTQRGSGMPRSCHSARSTIDVAIRFGELPDSRLIARKIAANRRRLCAAPAYLEAHGTPEAPKDLASHNCIVLRQNDAAFGIWRLSRGKQSESVKVRGSLSTNDGEVALNWALDGQGILMRAEWNLADHLRWRIVSSAFLGLAEDLGFP